MVIQQLLQFLLIQLTGGGLTVDTKTFIGQIPSVSGGMFLQKQHRPGEGLVQQQTGAAHVSVNNSPPPQKDLRKAHKHRLKTTRARPHSRPQG